MEKEKEQNQFNFNNFKQNMDIQFNRHPHLLIEINRQEEDENITRWIDLLSFENYEDLKKFSSDYGNPKVKGYAWMPPHFNNKPMIEDLSTDSISEEEFENIKEYSELNDVQQDIYKLFLQLFRKDYSVHDFKNSYQGHFDSYEEFAYDNYISNHNMDNFPHELFECINWTQYAKGLKDFVYQINGYFFIKNFD